MLPEAKHFLHFGLPKSSSSVRLKLADGKLVSVTSGPCQTQWRLFHRSIEPTASEQQRGQRSFFNLVHPPLTVGIISCSRGVNSMSTDSHHSIQVRSPHAPESKWSALHPAVALVPFQIIVSSYDSYDLEWIPEQLLVPPPNDRIILANSFPQSPHFYTRTCSVA